MTPDEEQALRVAAMKSVAERHVAALLFESSPGARDGMGGIASGVLVRYDDELFVFSAGHNFTDERTGPPRDFRIGLGRDRLVGGPLNVRILNDGVFDAAVVQVPNTTPECLECAVSADDLLVLSPVDAALTQRGQISLTGFPGELMKPPRRNVQRVGLSVIMTSIAGIRGAPLSPIPAPRWMLDAWLPAAGATNPDDLFDASPAPDLNGMSGGAVWWTSDARSKPQLIGTHAKTIGLTDGDRVDLDQDRFARLQLLAVHLSLAALLSRRAERWLKNNHPVIRQEFERIASPQDR